MRLISGHYLSSIRLVTLHLLFIQTIADSLQFQATQDPASNELAAGNGAANDDAKAPPHISPPQPVPAASYLSLDSLMLVVVFDKPVNLSASIETAERRRAAIEWVSEPTGRAQHSITGSDGGGNKSLDFQASSQSESSHPHSSKSPRAAQHEEQCQFEEANEGSVQHPVQGVQLCAKLLSKKTLKFLHKHKLYDCLWASRVQLLIQLAKPISGQQLPIKVTFQRHSIGAYEVGEQALAPSNEREFSVELNKLPLESLGLPLAPRLALTGPNQVPPCGQFTLSAHLSSPYGTQPGEQVSLSWSVERVGFIANQANGTSPSPPQPGPPFRTGSSLLASAATTASSAADAELRWRALQQVVASNKANNLVLDSQLLNLVPQLYQFRVTASYTTSLNSVVNLNATHQVGRIDYETPTGTIYGTHLLAQNQQLNPNQDLLLLADVNIPDCASNVKQVGLYWQVSDPRVRFEQTYAPYYLARPNSLPEQSTIEFRLNLFYGLQVKKYSSAGTLVSMGDSLLDAQISDGTLVVSIGQDVEGRALELFASAEPESSDKYTYQWSCFDGKTAQACSKSTKAILATAANSSTRYEIGAGAISSPVGLFGQPAGVASSQLGAAQLQQQQPQLVDRARQRSSALRIPLGWLDSDAQLWFGLQRFDKQNPSQQSQSEYALVSVQPNQASIVSIGPILVGRSLQRTTLRNPLTGAVILVAGAPAIIVGRIRPSSLVKSFAWTSTNYLHSLDWTVKNATNPFNGERELLTELHLNKDLQLAYGQHRFQLSVCTQTGSTTASIQLDIVPSVGQCRVLAQPAALGNGLVVSVDFCNIPLGLSPVTYQLYLADSSAADQLVHESQAGGLAAAAASTSQLEPDYINETDEAFLELRAEPLTMPQLSPVFTLSGLNGPSLMALLHPRAPGNGSSGDTSRNWPQSQIRFGARVCDRLQGCHMFYSAPVALRNLVPATGMPDLVNQSLSSAQLQHLRQLGFEGNRSLESAEPAPTALVPSIKTMIDTSRRASLAGNSIAAMALLNGAIKLGQNALSQQQQQQKPSLLRQQETDRNNLRDLVQVAMRDCLQYGAQSMKRPFHYTDSGQTSLVTHIVSRILRAPQSSIELRFKAIRLLVQVTRKSINEQLELKLNTLADMRALQAAFSGLFGAFSHYSIDSNEKQEQLLVAANNILSSGNQQAHGNASSATRFSTFVNSALSSVMPNQSSIEPAQSGSASLAQQTSSANRKKREEAILAHLRSLRLAHRQLLAAAAIQLPLGDAKQLQYTSLGATQEPAEAAPAEIVSSLSHLTEFVPSSLTATINADLHEHGSVTIQVEQKFSTRFNSQLAAGKLRCRNDTATKCSSFVLAISSFAGKAPFRALDLGPRLRLPVVEVLLLSPVDGSNLVELMRDGSDSDSSEEYSTTVTFVVPRSRLSDNLGNATSETSPRRKHKCYRFNEDLNEWSRSSEPPVETSGSDSELGSLSRIRCSFVGRQPFGVFAAFQGKPPQAEAAVRSPVVLGLLVLMGLVFLFSMVGCFATSSHSKRGSEGDKSDDEDDVDGLAKRASSRHPEQSLRKEFNYPPL